MRKLLTALDNSLAASPVLTVARELAPLLGCDVDALHVLRNGDGMAHTAAESAGITLRTGRGPLVESLIHAGEADDVVAMVIGARSTPGGSRPLGSTALAVATQLSKPIVVVPPDIPPDIPPGDRIRRVLVPIDGARSAALTPRATIEPAEGAEIDIVALHVLEKDVLPAVTDQPQHEWRAWAQEFIHRYCDWHVGTLRLETRVGRPQDLVPEAAETLNVDLVALGWSQHLEPGRAPTVRAVLERCHRPVLLIPVHDPVPDPVRAGSRSATAAVAGVGTPTP